MIPAEFVTASLILSTLIFLLGPDEWVSYAGWVLLGSIPGTAVTGTMTWSSLLVTGIAMVFFLGRTILLFVDGSENDDPDECPPIPAAENTNAIPGHANPSYSRNRNEQLPEEELDWVALVDALIAGTINDHEILRRVQHRIDHGYRDIQIPTFHNRNDD